MPTTHALWIGLAQVAAFIPGASRSGVTLTATRFLGYSWEDSAKFALLLGLPAIAAVAGGSSISLLAAGIPNGLGAELALAAGLAFVVALATLPMIFWLLRKVGVTPFVVYRLLFGVVLLVVFV